MRTFSKKMLEWYDVFHRTLPWRAQPGKLSNPYHVWLSEVMLQQTTVATVKNYFTRFIEKWPTLQDFATASIDEVLYEWQGLGYYSRAHNLHKCAQQVTLQFGGQFPTPLEDLLSLPGIGPYTAAAIRNIAFNELATAVDGNIARIMARITSFPKPIKMYPKDIFDIAAQYLPHTRYGDYIQSLMDLGSMICTPKNPKCDVCPVSLECRSFQEKTTHLYPVPLEKKERPVRFTNALLLFDGENIVLEKRPDKGLLKGLVCPLLTEFTSEPIVLENSSLKPISPLVEHTFTHFHLKVSLWQGVYEEDAFETLNDKNLIYHPLDALDQLPLPTLAKKILRATL